MREGGTGGGVDALVRLSTFQISLPGVAWILIQLGLIQFGSLQFSPAQFNSVQFDSIQFSSIQFSWWGRGVRALVRLITFQIGFEKLLNNVWRRGRSDRVIIVIRYICIKLLALAVFFRVARVAPANVLFSCLIVVWRVSLQTPCYSAV